MILVEEYNRPIKSSMESLHELDKSISKVHADHPNLSDGEICCCRKCGGEGQHVNLDRRIKHKYVTSI